MGSFMRKLFAPWTAGDCFDDLDDFYVFLLRRNKLLNAVRVVFFLIAAACLMLGYAFEHSLIILWPSARSFWRWA